MPIPTGKKNCLLEFGTLMCHNSDLQSATFLLLQHWDSKKK